MNKHFSHILYLFIVFILLFCLLVTPRRRQASRYETVVRDSVVYEVSRRDTTIYDIHRRDSVITTYHYVRVTDFDTVIIEDTAYMMLPLTSHHFTADSVADIYVTGYKVSLDSVSLHFRDVTKKVTERVAVAPRRLSLDAGFAMYRHGGIYVAGCDVTASLRMGSRWSAAVSVGMTADRLSLTPYVGAGVRYRVW